jgi:hypothetical protein
MARKYVHIKLARIADLEQGDIVRLGELASTPAALTKAEWRRVASVETTQGGDAISLTHEAIVESGADQHIDGKTVSRQAYDLVEVQVTDE